MLSVRARTRTPATVAPNYLLGGSRAGHPHPIRMNGGMGSVKQHIAKANEADCLANAEVQTREEGGHCNLVVIW